MISTLQVMTAILATNATIAFVLGAWLVWLARNRESAAAHTLIAAVAAAIIWMVAYLLELRSPTVAGKLLWANIQFVGIGLAPLLWLETTRLMIGSSPSRPASRALLLAIPIATVVLAFTSGAHDIFRGPDVRLELQMGLSLLDADYRWFHNALFVPYVYGLYAAGVFLLLRGLTDAHPGFRRGYAVMLAGLVLPLAGSLLYVLGIAPFTYFNPTAVLLVITIIAYLVILPRLHLLDVVPVARSRVLDTLVEGVIVLDIRGRIVDVNDAACRLLPELGAVGTAYLIGRPFRELVDAHLPLVLLAERIQQSESAFELEIDGAARYYLARPSVILDGGGQPRGLTLAISDITESTELIQSLRAARRDPVTASDVRVVLNRREFVSRLDSEVRRARITGDTVVLGVIRLDAGHPGPLRETIGSSIGRAGDPLVWVSWLEPDLLAVLLPGREREAVHGVLMAALEGQVGVAIAHEVPIEGDTEWQAVLEATQHELAPRPTTD